MAEDKRTTPGEKPRRRPAPTIDLKATEVNAADTQPGPAPDATAQGGKPGAAERSDAPAPSPSTRPSLLAAVAAGGVAGAAVFGALWGAGLMLAGSKQADDPTPRLAAIEAQIRDLAQRPPPQVDTKAIDALAQRVGRIEQAAGKAAPPDSALTERVAAVESSLAGLNQRTAGLQTEARQAAAAQASSAQAAVERLSQRLDALEQSAKATQDKVAQNSGTDAVARQALAAFALRDAVSRNTPYSAELAAVKALGADAKSVGQLEPFAATGLPADAALSRELAALIPAMMKAANADTAGSGGFVERLQANASRLVRIRPVGEPSGDDPAAVLARIEVKLARNDVAGAQQELASLPANTRALAEPWSKKVSARNAALTAGRKLATDAAAALAVR
jgi:hypothetical protein